MRSAWGTSVFECFPGDGTQSFQFAYNIRFLPAIIARVWMTQSRTIVAISMAAAVVIMLTVGVSVMAAQNADAQNRNAVIIRGSWAQTSIAHNAEGHSVHQVVDLFKPVDDLVYNGKVTFSSSKGVDIFAYHDITGQSMNTTGLRIWKVADKTYAANALMTNVTSGTVEFVGSGLLTHSGSSDEYKVVFSADGYARKATPGY